MKLKEDGILKKGLLFLVTIWTVKFFFWLVVSKSPSSYGVSYWSSILSAVFSLPSHFTVWAKNFWEKLSRHTIYFFIRFLDEPDASLNSRLMEWLIQQYPDMDSNVLRSKLLISKNFNKLSVCIKYQRYWSSFIFSLHNVSLSQKISTKFYIKKTWTDYLQSICKSYIYNKWYD